LVYECKTIFLFSQLLFLWQQETEVNSNVQITNNNMLKKNTWVFLIFLLIGIALYATIINTFFISDDFDWLVSGDISIFFRPLSRISFIANYAVGGLSPVSYHTVNLLLHVLNAFMLFLIIPVLLSYFNIEIKDHCTRWLSFLCALFFLTLSTHSESVTWISGRTNLLAMLFMLLSLYAYIKSKIKGEKKLFVLALGSFLLALLSKEAVLPFPLIILGLDIFKKLSEKQKPVPGFHAISFFLVLAVYLGIRYVVTGQLLGTYKSDFFDVKLMIDNFRKFTLRSFLPAGDYLFVIMRYKLDFLLAGLLGFFLWKRKKNIWFYCFLVSGFVLLLVPVLNLDISLIDTTNERFTYLASAYGAMVLVLLIVLLVKKKIPGISILVILAAVNIIGLFHANANWNNAAEISKSILDSFKEVSPLYEADSAKDEELRHPVILNLPDSIKGAYIYRRGFSSAVKLFQGRDVTGKIHVVSTHILQHVDDGINVVNRGDGRFYLHIKENRFMQSPVLSLPPYYEVENPNPHELHLKMDKLYQGRPVLYYSNKRLNVLLK
jgi:hypothetical protein